MKRHLPRILSVGIAVLGAWAANDCFADHNVAVTATATSGYTQHKFGGGKTAPETYVLKPGRFANSGIPGDSRDHTTVQAVAAALAPELARAQYLPAKDIKDADLGIVVNWGTGGEESASWPLQAQPFLTEPTVPGNRGQLLMDHPTTPSSPHVSSPNPMPSFTGSYFVTLEAYDLRVPLAERKDPVWTVHLRIPATGNNFSSALQYLSAAAADFAGRQTEERRHVRPVLRADQIATGPVVIVDAETNGPAAGPAGS